MTLRRSLPLFAAVLGLTLPACTATQKARAWQDGKTILRAGEVIVLEVGKAELKALIEEELK